MPIRPLADRIRPTSLDEIVGQEQLFGERGSIRRILDSYSSSGYLPNMIFYGPPGTGKTTAANLIAERSGMAIHKLNATVCSLADVKEVIASTKTVFGSAGTLLYLDEIQYFNRRQQQSLLEFIEDGRVTLISSTTENPYLYVYPAILSRSAVFEFKPVTPQAVKTALLRAYRVLAGELPTSAEFDDALERIATLAAGDVRRSLNLLECAYNLDGNAMTAATVDSVCPDSLGAFDKNGTVHYDMLSALQKSIRGSDPDAAIFYLAKILSGGDLTGACRRLQVIASEDIGCAYPMACAIARACVESAMAVGLPEAELPLSNLTIILATAPKSNSAHEAYTAALKDVEAGLGQTVPPYMRPSNQYKGYKYPHNYEHHYVKQSYLPEELADRRYYEYADNKTEQAAKRYWDEIKGNREKS